MKCIHWILILCLTVGCTSKSSISNVMLTAEVKQSSKNDALITIKNQTGELLYYNLALEAMDSLGKWQEIVMDVNISEDFPKAKISTINVGEHARAELNMRQVLNGLSNSFNTFRFKMSYGLHDDRLNNRVWSNPFSIKTPYVPDNILVFTEDRNRRHTIMLASEEWKIDSLLVSEKDYGYLREDALLQKIIINKKTIEHIITYLNTVECPDYNDGQECDLFGTIYELEWYDQRSFRKYCMSRVPDAKKVFIGLKQYLKQTSNHTDYLEFEVFLDRYIKRCIKGHRI